MKTPGNNEKLGSARRTLKNAQRHIATLESECLNYFQLKPLGTQIEIDSESGHEVHKLVVKVPLPELIEQAAFDAANNLRSALDQACYAIAIASGNDGKKAHFPFGKTLEDVRGKKKKAGGSRDIPDEVFSLILAIKPYKDGNLLLWELNDICNKGKHEIITPVGAQFEPMGIVKRGKFEHLVRLALPPKWDFERQEMILAIVGRGSKYEYEMQVSPFLAIAGNGAFSQENALLVLSEMEKAVLSVLDQLEEKMSNLGL
ncbi:hypothetical protein [Janthinobacterium lividum]|uniref:hypothetical protein n=1 Tax=Janthinobacterium lividum TaxID=29581 RepID=UPI001B82107E|nr:hypothetical protein [Janthinobacterium lividum]MBR7633305.1 hypothetical protein [Janthinobacterium lividum]